MRIRLADLSSLQPAMVRNLIAVYRTADYGNVRDGQEWYPKAREIVRQWSAHYSLDVRTVAAVVAVISPQCAWENNLIIADDVLAGRLPSVHGALNANLQKAYRIIADGAVDVSRYSPGGFKVQSFASNLAGNDGAVTVDTHAMQAALGDPTFAGCFRRPHYLIYSEVYRQAARKVRRLPSEFQAIVWLAWKSKYPAGLKRWHARNGGTNLLPDDLPPSLTKG